MNKWFFFLKREQLYTLILSATDEDAGTETERYVGIDRNSIRLKFDGIFYFIINMIGDFLCVPSVVKIWKSRMLSERYSHVILTRVDDRLLRAGEFSIGQTFGVGRK